MCEEYLAHCRSQCGSAACDVIDESFSNGLTFNNEQIVYIIISVNICFIINNAQFWDRHSYMMTMTMAMMIMITNSIIL